MDDPWGSSTLSLSTATSAPAWARDDTASPTSTTAAVPFPSLPAPAILTRGRKVSPLHLAPSSAAHGGARPNTPGHMMSWTGDGLDEDPFNVWADASGGAGTGGGLAATTAAAAWASSATKQTLLRPRASTRASLSLSPSPSPSPSPSVSRDYRSGSGPSPRLAPLGILGGEPSPDPWARSSPAPSESGAWLSEGYVLRKFNDAGGLGELPQPWGERENVEMRSSSRRTSLAGFGNTTSAVATVAAAVEGGNVVDRPIKVQGLVAMYDSMARRGSWASRRSRSPAPSVESRHVPESHAAALPKTAEEAVEEVEEETEVEVEEAGVQNPEEKRPRLHDQQADASKNGHPLANTRDTSQSPASIILTLPPPAPEKPKPRPVSIPYPIDLTLLDQLFPNTPAPQPVPTTLPSNGDPRDSINTPGERSIWHRVSRNGSMHQHHHRSPTTPDGASSSSSQDGNKERYARVGWVRSVVRDEAVGIVRRWLEDVSAGRKDGFGRNRFGGAGAGGMFNWDSHDAPVSLDQLFGPRRSLRYESGGGSGGERWEVGTPMPSSSVQPPSPAARFSWSTTGSPTAVSANTTVPPSPLRMEHGAASRGEGTKKAVHAQSWSLSLPPRGVSAAVKPADNDDEWGEMVSTPAGEHVMGDAGSGFASWTMTTAPLDTTTATTTITKRASLVEKEPTLAGNQTPSSEVEKEDEDMAAKNHHHHHHSTAPHAAPHTPPQTPHLSTARTPTNPHHRKEGTGPLSETRESSPGADAETDALAIGILDRLPDMSYMLQ